MGSAVGTHHAAASDAGGGVDALHHEHGLIVGDIQKHLGITASNLSHHLEKLKNHDLVVVRRDGTFLTIVETPVPRLDGVA